MLSHARCPACIGFQLSVSPVKPLDIMFLTSLPAFASIMITTLVTMISIGVQSEDPVEYHAFRQISFYEGFLAFTNIMFGFSMFSAYHFLTSESPTNLRRQLFMSPSLDLSLRLRTHKSSRRPLLCCRSPILSCISLRVL